MAEKTLIPVEPEGFDSLANQVAGIAEDYRKLAAEMRRLKLRRFDARGLIGVGQSLKKLQANVRSNQVGLRQLIEGQKRAKEPSPLAGLPGINLPDERATEEDVREMTDHLLDDADAAMRKIDAANRKAAARQSITGSPSASGSRRRKAN